MSTQICHIWLEPIELGTPGEFSGHCIGQFNVILIILGSNSLLFCHTQSCKFLL